MKSSQEKQITARPGEGERARRKLGPRTGAGGPQEPSHWDKASGAWGEGATPVHLDGPVKADLLLRVAKSPSKGL